MLLLRWCVVLDANRYKCISNNVTFIIIFWYNKIRYTYNINTHTLQYDLIYKFLNFFYDIDNCGLVLCFLSCFMS